MQGLRTRPVWNGAGDIVVAVAGVVGAGGDDSDRYHHESRCRSGDGDGRRLSARVMVRAGEWGSGVQKSERSSPLLSSATR